MAPTIEPTVNARPLIESQPLVAKPPFVAGRAFDSISIHRATMPTSHDVHSNFAEYAPFAIVLMALAELQGQSTWTIHLIGSCLIAGRLLHAYEVSQDPEPAKLRVAGMALTFTALISGARSNLGPTGLVSLALASLS